MPISIFDDQPAPSRRSRSHTPSGGFDPFAEPPRNRKMYAGVAFLAVALAAGGTAAVRSGLLDREPPEQDAPTYLVTGPTTRPKGECVDASSSSGDRGALARTALTTTNQVLRSWVRGDEVSEAAAYDAQPGLSLTVRIVQADSFTTAGANGSTAMVTVPDVPGLSKPAPLPAEDDFLALDSIYRREHASVEGRLTKAREAITAGAADVRRLVGQISSGSDVTGCVLALAEILGPDSDILVVSDLQDTRFTAPEDARLTGRMNGVRLFIAQSCPSGDPRACRRDQATFVRRLLPLGLTADDVTTARPELGADLVRTWLGR